jgi:hypothetical protein
MPAGLQLLQIHGEGRVCGVVLLLLLLECV